MSASAPAHVGSLENRRFAVRFLGRPGAWLWFAVSAALAAGAWAAVALPARGDADAMRSWALWSGNVLLALFAATMLFVGRKWSIKLRYFRDYGRASPGAPDAAWAAVQELNAKIRKGAFASDREILEAARQILARHGTQRIQRAELRTLEVGGATVKFVELRKKEPFGRLEPWLEMHMGLGTTACLGVLFHADLALRHPVGWTLLALSAVVLVTGVLGAVLYRLVPERLAKADAGIPYEEAGVARQSYQSSIDGILATLEEPVRAEFAPLAEPSRTPEALASRAASILGRVAAQRPERAELARDLVVMAGSRDNLLWSTRRARSLDRWLRVWRWVHVPASVALFAAIGLHVWAVIWY